MTVSTRFKSFSPVNQLSHSAKFTTFIVLSFALHLLFLSVDFSTSPVQQRAQTVGVGLVHRPFAQFSPSTKNLAHTEPLKVLPQPTAALPMQTAVADKKQQLLQAKIPASKVQGKPANKRPAAEPTQIPMVADQQLQSSVVEKKISSEPLEHPAKVAEMSPAIEIAENFKRDSVEDEGAQPTNAELAGLGSATSSAVTLTATPGFQDALPRYDQNPIPSYPEASRRRGQEGTVLLEVAVQTDGLVEKVVVTQSSGYKQLDIAALTAVQRWQFRPATSSGLPVSSRVVVPVDFVLQEKN